jgi:hypothetical protein
MTRTKWQRVLLTVAALGFAGTAWGQSLKMNAVAGFNGHAKPGRWMPVTVTIDNQGNATEGTLTLRLSTDRRTAQFYTPVNLPNTSRKQFFLYSLAEDTDRSEVSLNVRGVRPVGLNLHLDSENDQLILAVSSEGEGGLSYISGLRGVGRPPLSQSGNYYGGPAQRQEGSNTHVIYASPGQLPDRWLGYDPLDAVVLQNFSPRDFTDEQIKALRTWVSGGGTLVVSGGSNYQRLSESFVADMLPVKVTGSQVLASAPRLLARYGAGLWSGAPLVVSQGKALSGSQVFVEENGVPLVVAGNFGAGHVVYLAFDPTRPPVAGWEGSRELWRDVLTWAGDRPLATSAYEEGPQPAYYRGGYSSSQGGGSLNAALMNIPSMQAPPFQFIGLFLCLYVLFLVPVNYFALKKLGKRELAWVTTPFIVLIFTFLSYGVGFSIKGGTLRVNKLTIVQSQAGAAWGAADTVFGIFSPSKTGYTLTTAEEEGAVSDLLPESYSTEQSALVVRQDQKMLMEDYRINMWAMKLFRARSVVNTGRGVTAQFQASNGGLRAVVRNATSYNFAAAALIVGQQAVPLNALPAGGTATVSLPLASSPAISATQQVINTFSTAEGSDQQRNLRQAALSALLKDEFSTVGVNLLAQGALFVGWTAQDALEVNIAGHKPQVEQGTLVVVRLPLDLPFAPSSESLVTGRIVASNLDDLAQRTPGSVQLEQNQFLVYEFRLPVRGERVNVKNLYVTAQWQGAANVSAYNFARRRYDALDVSSAGTSPLSPALQYLRLPDGMVRVRVEATAQTQLSALRVGVR